MRAATVLKAVRGARWHSLGTCPICGRRSVFLQLVEGSFREGLTCAWCRSPSRKRHVALVLREALGHADVTTGEAVRRAGARVLSTQSSDALSGSLANYVGYQTSDLVPGRALGESIGVRATCQDLERLTFGDGAFDVVLTEDVLEHVRRPDAAFSEIHRVLVPGGRHVFTIPYFVDQPTLTRVDSTGEEDVHLLPREYHGDPIRGQILAYRTFGFDLLPRLEQLGFDTRMHLSDRRTAKAGVYDSIVFVSTRLR